MTNSEIIINEALLNNIFTKEQIESMVKNGIDIPLHTFQTWKELGYSVKKGEHAKVTTRLWKRTKKGQGAKTPEELEEAKIKNHFYLTKAFLFTSEQVEKIEAS